MGAQNKEIHLEKWAFPETKGLVNLDNPQASVWTF